MQQLVSWTKNKKENKNKFIFILNKYHVVRDFIIEFLRESQNAFYKYSFTVFIKNFKKKHFLGLFV